MATIPHPPLNSVTSIEIDYETLFLRAGGQMDEPYPKYIFGNGRKVYMSNLQTIALLDKPTTLVGGKVVHLPDPDLI
jgi:hypothetical protein